MNWNRDRYFHPWRCESDAIGHAATLMPSQLGKALCGAAPGSGTLWELAETVTCVACQRRIIPETRVEWTPAAIALL